MTAESLRDRLQAGETAYGAWSVLPGAVSVTALASAGVDYVVIDLQHGAAAERDLPELTSAIRLAGGTPLSRVRYAHPADIGRVLDLGCDGVIVPNVDSAGQAQAIAGACRYPPVGPVGVHATDGATARLYRGNGCRLVTVAADAAAIRQTASAQLAIARD